MAEAKDISLRTNIINGLNFGSEAIDYSFYSV
jgi:hypothetical protein